MVRGDVRFAFRSITGAPRWSLVVVVTLALGSGVLAAVFAVVDTMVLRGLPYPESNRLVHFQVTNEESGAAGFPVAYADFEVLRDRVTSLESVAGYSNAEWIHSGVGREPRRIRTAPVTKDFFDVLEVHPLFGRAFVPEEHREGSARSIVLSHSFWTGQFGSDPSIVGRAITLDQAPFVVVGVMPPGFDYPYLTEMEGWTPLVDRAFLDADSTSAFAERDWISVNIVGRLDASGTLEQAQTEVASISRLLADDFPETNRGLVHGVRPMIEIETRTTRTPMLLALLSALLVLMVAALNVTSLMVARGAQRAGDTALRVALGATRWRVIRLYVIEATLLAGLGALCGLGIATLLLAAIPELGIEAPLLGHVQVSVRVLLTITVSTLGLGAASGIAAAVHGAGSDQGRSLGRVGARIGRPLTSHRLLVALELSVATVLAIGAGLLFRSYDEIASVNPGFDPAGVVTMRLNLPSQYMSDPVDPWSGSRAFFDEATESLRALPDVRSVGLSFTNPLEPSGGFRTRVGVEGWLEVGRNEQPVVHLRPADAGYFETFSIPLVEGRLVDDTDDRSSEGVALVNEAFVRLVFGDQDPLGFQITGPNFWGGSGYPYPWTIVGVVGDVHSSGLSRDPDPAFYVPVAQAPMGNLRLVVGARGDAEALFPAVRSAVWALDDQLPVDELSTMEDEIAASVLVPRTTALIVGVFASLSALLAVIGVYGVTAYSIGLRRGEFGVRRALGAEGRDIARVVVVDLLRIAVPSVGIGLLAAVAASRLLESFLFGVRPADPATFVAVGAAMVIAALAGVVSPARAATSVDPTRAIRA